MIDRNCFSKAIQTKAICVVYSFTRSISALSNGSVSHNDLLESICTFLLAKITTPFDRNALTSLGTDEKIERLRWGIRCTRGYPYMFDVNHTFLKNEVFPELKKIHKLDKISCDFLNDSIDTIEPMLKSDSKLVNVVLHHCGGVHIVSCGYDNEAYIVDPNYEDPYQLSELTNKYKIYQYGDHLLFSADNS